MRSRKPIPKKLHELRGNPSKLKLSEYREPEPTRGCPTPPAWLGSDADLEWRRIVPELDRLGLLAKIDAAALEGHCTNYGRAVQAERVLDKDGITVTEEGRIKKHPAATIAKECWMMVRGFLAEFGLSPAARARLKSPTKTDDEDEFTKYLNKSG